MYSLVATFKLGDAKIVSTYFRRLTKKDAEYRLKDWSKRLPEFKWTITRSK